MPSPELPDTGRDPRWRRRAVTAAVALLAAGTTAPATAAAEPDARAGAQTPFTSGEAEDAETNGTVLGPDLTQGSLASEASGRRAVTLDGPDRLSSSPSAPTRTR
ncbi:hypothetical protein [Saccharopolyspora gregorii]|uniref:CBM6/CBM35/CBM36-like 1 domain-containing protein n=1 Tax=Saccharopolyspora gregorii TaxID=33914 RepID=A0ABP6S3N8_9PSEU